MEFLETGNTYIAHVGHAFLLPREGGDGKCALRVDNFLFHRLRHVTLLGKIVSYRSITCSMHSAGCARKMGFYPSNFPSGYIKDRSKSTVKGRL